MAGFIIGFVGALVGTVSGYLLKHIQDGRIVNELIKDVLDLAKKCDKKDAEIRKLMEEVNRYNSLIVDSIKETSAKCKVKGEAKTVFMNKSGDKAVIVDNKVIDPTFWDVKFVPDDVFGSDIDFGGKF